MSEGAGDSSEPDQNGATNGSAELPVVTERSWWSRQWVFTRKELRETLRDRRTIVTLIAMPLLLYPLLGLVFRLVALKSPTQRTVSEYRLALSSEREARWLEGVFEVVRDAERNRQDSKKRVDDSQVPPSSPEERVVFATADAGPTADFRELLGTGDIDLGVRVKFPARGEANGSSERPGPIELELFHDEGSAAGREARRIVERRLQTFNLTYLLDLQARRGLNVPMPVTSRAEGLAFAPKAVGLLGLLPLILLLMTVTGGVYPSIDLTAGERERDTLETLFALPVAPVRLLLAKYVAVLVVILLTGLVNLVAMSATVCTLQLEKQLFGESGFTLMLAARMFVVLVVFGMFYASVLLAITSAARSFKEAQAYLIPLMLMSLAPGLVVLLPGWRLEGAPVVLPVLNMLLLAREVIEGGADPFAATTALITTALYTAGALTLAARWFAADAVAVGSRASWADLLQRPELPENSPTLATSLVTLAALFPLYFFASGALGRWFDSSPTPRLLMSGGLTIGLFALFPTLVTTWQRIPLDRAWALRPARWLAWPGAIVLGLGTWPWIYELILGLQMLGIRAIDDDKRQLVEQLLQAWKAVPVPLLVICLGVLPGICEEFFFRGVLFGGLRRAMSGSGTVVVCALAFGLFHVILAGGAAPERLAPSMTMGLILGWIRLRTGSCWPGVILHVLHNSSLLILASHRDQLLFGAWNAENATHLPAVWLGASAAAIVFGLGWIAWSTRQKLVRCETKSTLSME